jgi:hypothetical protein
LLEFTKKTTYAGDEHPGVLQHYEIACLNHVVDVICTGPPRISSSRGRLTTEVAMDALAEQLDAKLRVWKPETADQVRERVAEVIELADQDVLDLLRSRAVEQDVLDLLDQPPG